MLYLPNLKRLAEAEVEYGNGEWLLERMGAYLSALHSGSDEELLTIAVQLIEDMPVGMACSVADPLWVAEVKDLSIDELFEEN